LAVSVLVGCGGAGEPTVSPPTPEPRLEAGLTVAACYDTTSSYDPALREQAQEVLASRLAETFGPGRDETTVYVQTITSHSYPPENTLLTIEVPGVPNPPAEPVIGLTPEPPELNPFGGPQATEAAGTATAAAAGTAAANASAVSAYEQAVREHTAFVDGTRAEFLADLEALRRLSPETDPLTSDQWGCIARAGERLMGHAGERVLVIAGDLIEVAHQGRYPEMRLDQVRVQVISFLCEGAAECHELREYWDGELTALGAAEVEYHDPAQTALLTAADLFE
jgi:hypothetical protein